MFIIIQVLQLLALTTCMSIGKRKQMQSQGIARMNRIESLIQREKNSDEKKELHGLLKCGDSYNAELFTPEHQEFKRHHNQVFSVLSKYCMEYSNCTDVFYLDGKDCGTTTFLCQEMDFLPSNLYTANIFPETVNSLLNHRSGPKHVFHGKAQDILANELISKQFVGYYLDGCGGNVSSLISMIEAIFSNSRIMCSAFALGFTILNQDSIGLKSLCDREQEVTRFIATKCKHRSLHMLYVGDCPEEFGLSSSPIKRQEGGNTQTVWLIILKDEEGEKHNKRTLPSNFRE